MAHPSQIVSIHPYFKVKPGKLVEAKAELADFIRQTSNEPANLYYDFTLNEDVIFCREAYIGAEGLLRHLDNVGVILEHFLKLVDVLRVEIHGSTQELAKLKQPLAKLSPQWFEFVCGVSRQG